MTTFLLTSPATDMRNGRRGTLVLTGRAGPRAADGGGGTLVLAEDPEQISRDGADPGAGVRLADVEGLEIRPGEPAGAGEHRWSPPSLLILHLRDGSDATYRLSGSNPALLRRVFAEAGWLRPCRQAA